MMFRVSWVYDVPQKHALLLVHADDQSLLRDLFDRTRPGHRDFNARLQHRRGDHENDEQHQHHVDVRNDVDLVDRFAGAAHLQLGKRT